MEDFVRIGNELDDLSSSWHLLDKSYYALYKLSKLSWGDFLFSQNHEAESLDFSNMICAVCPNGGPIAVTLRRELLREDNWTFLRENIFIFTSWGNVLNKIPWKKSSSVVTMEFNKKEQLIVLENNRIVSVINPIDNKEIRQKDISSAIDNKSIETAKILDDYVIIASTDKKIIRVDIAKDWDIVTLCDRYSLNTLSEFLPEDIIVIEGKYSKSADMEVIIPDKDAGFHWIYEEKSTLITALSENKSIELEKINKLSLFSANERDKKILALVSGEEDLYIVWSNDISGTVKRFSISNGVPSCIDYCGAITLIYPDQVIILGANDTQEEIEVSSRGGVICFRESDGVRVLTADAMYFLEKMPEMMEETFKIGSNSLSSELISNYYEFLTGSPTVEVSIKEVIDKSEAEVLSAVKMLIRIGNCMWDVRYQKYIFKAISYTQTYVRLKSFDARRFTNSLQRMRVINLMRSSKYERAITFNEFKEMTPKGLINLARRYHHYFLATELSRIFGKENIDYLFEEWAIHVLSSNTELKTEELYKTILDRIKDYPNVSYRKIAEAARKNHYEKLAIDFLAFTDPIEEQIPELVSMRRFKDAIKIALDNCEFDVVYAILGKMREMKVASTEALEIFLSLNNTFESPLKFFLSYAIQQERLGTTYITMDAITNRLATIEKNTNDSKRSTKKIESSVNSLKECMNIETIILTKKASTAIKAGAEMLKNALNFPITKKLIESYVNCLELKRKYAKAKELPYKFIKCNALIEGTQLLVEIPQLSTTLKHIANEFKIDEVTYNAIKFVALAKSRNWKEFEELYKTKHKVSKRFVIRICLYNDNPDLATEYVKNIKNLDEKNELAAFIDNYTVIKRHNEESKIM